jgi:hypothetical protein
MEKKEWNEVLSREGKIDPVKYGIGMPGEKGSPKALIDGREPYRRIFIRLRTPQETLACSPIRDGADFASRASIIENWFNSVVRKGNFILTFEALQVTDEQADEMEKESINY